MNHYKIPDNLECAYCKRNPDRGGECRREKFNQIIGCLAFDYDQRGCIRSGDMTLPIPIYQEIEAIGMWWTGWEYKGIETEIRVRKIFGFKWDVKAGLLFIKCGCDYFVNEYDMGYQKETKPKLTVLKGGNNEGKKD